MLNNNLLKQISSKFFISSFLLFSLLYLISCKKNSSSKNIGINSTNAEYIKRCDSVITKLDTEHIESRSKFISEIKSTDFYRRTIIEKEVSAKNLHVLHTICSGIINFDTASGYSIPLKEEMSMTVDERKFFSNVVALIQPSGEGFTLEILELFDRYKEKYKLYGKKDIVLYSSNGSNIDTIDTNFDFSPFYVLIDFTNKKTIDAIFESRLLGIRNWENPRRSAELAFPFIAFKEGYQAYLKFAYPESKYFLDYQYEGTVSALLADYQANEVAADKKYKNKGILLTGTVARIMKDASDNNIIVLMGNDFMSTVQCKVSEEDALNVSKNQKVKIFGRVKGMSINNVLLDVCQLY
jgi:hypothetical protein